MNYILQLIGISKSFNRFAVINNVDLNIIHGEKHALIGPNGAGKTTMFNLITGRYYSSKGKILFKNRVINNTSIFKISKYGIARSFQIINIFRNMTVFENLRNAVVSKHKCNLKLFCLLGNIDPIKRDIDYLLERLNLTEFKNEVAGTLGYGQQRVLEIGLAVALEPELILFDEPTAGMTPAETTNIVGLIREITAGKTMIVIEHDMEVVFNLADRISVLHYGQLIATGSPEEIRRNSKVREAYLGMIFDAQEMSNGNSR